MQPLYTPKNTNAAYQLNWSLTVFWRHTSIAETNWLEALKSACEPDDIRILRHHATDQNGSLFFVSTKPNVSPIILIGRVKGRLQYLIRDQIPKAFKRNYCLQSVGTSKRKVVETYVAGQLERHRLADPRVQLLFKSFQYQDDTLDLGKPSFSSHGKYWYNIHVVLENEGPWREIREPVLRNLRIAIDGSAEKHGYKISRIGLLPDHIHLTLACPLERCPEDIALSFLNNCAYACEMKPIFKYSYYVGTIGEYDSGAAL